MSKLTLISTATVSGAASAEFTSGIDSTYNEYVFYFFNVQPTGDNAHFSFQGNVAGQSGFNETITSTSFRAYNYESGGTPALEYYAPADQAQGTGYQWITGGCGNDSDQSLVGALHLFNPASTTYVKNFYAQGQSVHGGDAFFTHFTAGYFNVTGAIDEISFAMTHGSNIGAATIKMYGAS